MKKFLVISCFLVFYSFVNVYSQVVVLKEINSDVALSDVLVSNNNKTIFIVSSEKGIVNLSVFSDKEEIVFYHISYESIITEKNKIKNGVLLFTKISGLLPEVVLSVSNNTTDTRKVSEQISVISAKDIKNINPQTTPDLLASTPGITVQKSQMGGGSPAIRGFEANRVLMVVDGVRLNNAIYRSGHLQNSLSIDHGSIDRMEVVYGPSSTKYGSDALGGVIHFYTKEPKLGEEQWNSNLSASYSTANKGISIHADALYNNKKLGSFTSISFSEFNDLKMGTVRNHGFEDWGKVFNYSKNTETYYNDIPSKNTDVNLQKNTGFTQIDAMQKLVFKLNSKNNLVFNLQYSNSSNIPRFDALTDESNGSLKWAEWYYGPQERLLISSKLSSEINKPFMLRSNIIIAYQNVKESRMQRKFESKKKTFREENVDVLSLNADFFVKYKNNDISYGTEVTFNNVNSTAQGKTLVTSGNSVIGTDSPFAVQTRYPDGGSNYSSFAIYTDVRKDVSRKTTFNYGLRFTSTLMHANWVDDTFIKLPDSDIALSNNAITGNIGIAYLPNRKWTFKTHLSSGFRSPNIDDVGKVREKSDLLTVPNTSLKPEYALNYEINVERYLLDRKLLLSLDLYYTRIFDYISRQPYKINGQDSLVYDGVNTKTIANVNSGQAHVYGGNIGLLAKISNNLKLKSFLTYTKGEMLQLGMPMPSIAPLFGSTSLILDLKKWRVNINANYNGHKKAEDFDVYGGVDNLDKAASVTFGTPAWYTINTSVLFKASENINLRFAVDNILDHHYLPFASGISAPGRNFTLTVSGNL